VEEEEEEEEQCISDGVGREKSSVAMERNSNPAS